MPRAILASLLALVSIAADWPGWRGPTGDGRAVDAEYPLKWGAAENVKWRVPLAGTGHSSPAVVGGKIFITGCVEAKKERVLYCLDRTNGSVLWEKAVLASPLEGKHAGSTLNCGIRMPPLGWSKRLHAKCAGSISSSIPQRSCCARRSGKSHRRCGTT